VVIGEPGMGKSRLAEEAAAEMARRWDARILEGRCVPYGEANVWWAVAELLRDLFDLAADTEAPEARRVVEAALEDLLTEQQAAHAHRYATGMLHALGYQTPLRGGDRHRNRAEVTLAVTVALEAELRNRPVVLVLSDVHWAAEAVWALIEHLLDESARQRLLVIVTARDLERVAVPVGRHGLVVLQLDRLDERAAHQLLLAAGVDLPVEAAVELVRRSGGNPFFLEELAALVADRPPAERDELVGQLAEGRLGVLPDTLRGLVAARLDSLPADERALLDDAAVLGRSGPVQGLATMAGERRSRTSIAVELAALEAKDLLTVDGNRYEFRSDLVRDVAYGMLTKTDRALRHHGIATYLESNSGPVGELRSSVVARIAENYRMAAQLTAELRYVPGVDAAAVSERALHWIDEVARRSSAAGASRESERWYGIGAELATDDCRKLSFLLGRAQVRCSVHDVAGSRADLERIAAVDHGDPLLDAQALLVAGDLDRKAGDLDSSVERLTEAAARFEALDAPSDRASALRLLGLARLFRGEDEAASAALETSRDVAAAAGDRRAEGWALQSLAWHAFLAGLVSRARVHLAEASQIFTALDDRSGLAWVQGLEAWVAFHLGEWDDARSLIEGVLPETRRRGDRWAEGVMLNLLASLELWSGRPSVAVEVGRAAVEVAEEIENAPLATQSRCTTGHALVAVGRVAEGVSLLDDAYVLATRASDRESLRQAVVSNVASAARIGEPERAIRWASRFDSDHSDIEVVGEIDLVASLALALLQRGAPGEAASQLQPLLEPARDGSPMHPSALAVGAIVAAAEADAEAVEERAAAVLGGHSTYLDRVMAHLAVAAVRARTGTEVERDDALAAARAEVTATEDRVAPLLVALAAATMGVGSLTEAESAMRDMGLEPAAWRRAWALAASAGPVGV
jgi:tetratricopeptide (TPR) repeat protein